MAGIKHSMWGMYPEGVPSMSGKSQEDWQLQMATNHQAFCKLCGGQIHAVDQDEYGKRVNWELEMQNEVHTDCYYKFIAEQRESQYGSEPR